MNRVTIYKTKCIDIVTLQILPISCFRYNSEEKKHKNPESESEAKKN